MQSRIVRVAARLFHKARDWFVYFQRASQIQIFTQIRDDLRLVEEHVSALWLEVGLEDDRGGPVAMCGRKYFSQSDEDGITLEILRRIETQNGTCVEIGCGNGLENNSLILLAQGWKAVWIDGIQLAFDSNCNPEALAHRQKFVTTENVVELVSDGLRQLDRDSFDYLSIDVDGNDGYIAQELLKSGYRPSVLVVETNNLLPPPIRFQQRYVPTHVWNGVTTNYGISLQSASDIFSEYGYRCIACNRQTGVNAFFVRSDFLKYFSDVDKDLGKLYVGRSIRPFDLKHRKSQVVPALVELLVREISSSPAKES